MENREAIKMLKTILGTVYLGNRKFIEAVEKAISALEKQEQDRWIPVTKRLPEENGTYLACYEDATVLLDWFNGKWFFYRTNPAVEETGTIIAWRPLPEPYTEEES